MEAPRSENETARLAALTECCPLVPNTDPKLADLAQFAARIAQTPIAQINIVAESTQTTLSSFGFDPGQTPRASSFCTWTIRGKNPFVVHDATADPRFQNNQFVTGAHAIRFYAGFPVQTSDGLALGALCTLDTRPRELDLQQISDLAIIADQVAARLELNRLHSRWTSARAAAQREEERARLVIDAALDAVITIDVSGVITGWNAQAKETFGYSREEAVGRRLEALIIPERYREAHRAGLQRFVMTGEARVVNTRIELWGVHKDGREIPVELAITPVNLGERLFFSAFIRDITDRRRASEELRRAKEDAETAARAKAEFLANMSHEIRTPMTAILGYTELLSCDTEFSSSPVHRAEAIATIRRNGEHLLTVINDVLDVSKIEAGRMRIERIPMEPRRVIDEVVGLMSLRAFEHGLSISVECPESLPSTVLSDPVRFRQILMNLVSNAVKFTERGGVVVRAAAAHHEQGVELVVTVEDSGIGIAPDQLERLFDSFWQADASTTRRFGGTGLGLRISRALARLLGGDIEVRSILGKGSSFTFRMVAPLAKSVVPATTTPDAAASGRRNALVDVRILLAEDGPDNQRLIAHHLTWAGANVTTVSTGKSAVAALAGTWLGGSLGRAGSKYDLVVMDMQMPEMDGYTAARKLRERGVTIPILALTAHAMESDRSRCLDAGCDEYAAKPIDRAGLIDHCVQLLQQRRPAAA